MKTLKVVWNLVVIAFIAVSDPILVQAKRQKPRPDEIERIINATHSVIWECSTSECNPGLGLSVQCGTSIPISTPIKCVFCVKGVSYSDTHDYSTCKSCKNCGKHENKKGECTPEEDTTECLGTCFKGFYMDKITGDCHTCSDCCGEANKHHEKQCEDSGLPPNQQCRQNNVKCHNPTDGDTAITERQYRERKERLQALQIATIVVCPTVFVLIVVIILVIWKCFGWQQFKSMLKECCCCCCNRLRSNAGTTVNFHISDHFEAPDLESGALCINGSGSSLGAEETDGIGSLPSDLRDRTTKTVSKWSGFQRQCSVPVESRSDAKLKIPRSRSHPGCLNKHAQDSSDVKVGGLKKLLSDAKTKKLARKGYAPVANELPDIDDSPLEKTGKICLPKPTSSAHCEFSENYLQSVGSTVEDQGKERLQKPCARDQGTSTTELHLCSATLQVAGVPQDFLNSLLTKRMSAIPYKFLRKICIKLDTLRQLFWDDFRLLGEKVGLDKDEIALLKQKGNQTETIIDKFNSKKNSCIGNFIIILEEMERNDVITVIEEWVVDEWSKHKNNSPSTNCGKGYNFKSFV